MDLSKVHNKFKTLFKKFKEPGYILNNYYADGLVNKLYLVEDPETQQLEKQPFFTDLLISSIDDIENVHITVQVFVIRTLGVVFRNEQNFCKTMMSRKNSITRYMMDINKPGLHHSLRVALMEMALSLLEHCSGMSYLLEIGVWKEILSLCNEPKTIFIVRQMYKFASRFLWNINDMGYETLVITVLDFILKPLLSIELLTITSLTSEEEENIIKIEEPVVQILLSLFNDPKRIHTRSLIIEKLIQKYNIQSLLGLSSHLIHNDSLLMLNSKLSFWFANCKVFMAKPLTKGAVYDKTDLMEVTVNFYNAAHYYINKRNPFIVLDFAYFCHLIHTQVWIEHNQDALKDSTVQNVCLEYFIIPLVPVVSYIMLNKNKLRTELMQEKLDLYIHKLYYNTGEHSGRAAYGLRDLIAEMDIVPILLHSVKRISVMTKNLTDYQANVIFQGVSYLMYDYDPKDENGECKPDVDYDADDKIKTVIGYVVDIIYSLVRDYDINWKQSFEVLCLYTVISSVLTRPNLSCKFIVGALNLISITIKKFLPPNLSLLLELNPKSPINEIGQLIYNKLHDRNWEIRDSALELLLVCTEISFVKYPPFQNQITSNNLIEVAAALALNDHQYYVQASAIKCIAAASNVGSIWAHLLETHPDIKEKLLTLVYKSQEGVVRKEAVTALTVIYQNFKLSDSFKQELYQQLASVALSDFHWEVQIAAVQFWKKIIDATFAEQGMLDGVFPSVTFSKESRKIVTLNEAEIQRRIMKALSTLSNLGCLTILVKLLLEDTELDVMKHLYKIVNDLYDIFKQYKLDEIEFKEDMSVDDVEFEIKAESAVENMEPSTSQNLNIESDTVIDSIVNDSDLKILSNIFEKKLNQQNETDESDGTPKLKIVKNITPNLFINFVLKKEYVAVIEEKERWKDGIRSVSSLLDDVLGIYEDNEEINTMDCY